VTELFINRTEEEVMEVARRVDKKAVQNAAVFMEGENVLDLNSFLSWIEAEMDTYSIEIRYTIKDNGNHHAYILRHDAGKNYSLYYKTVLDLIFQEALQKRIYIITSIVQQWYLNFVNKV
jgi:hypothetical protein